eukprot:scaffold9020_cov75-Phaeocystis_antarctica.AAC.4
MLPWRSARAATLPMLSACDWAFGSPRWTCSCCEPRSASPYVASINVANSGFHVWMKTSTGAPTARTMWTMCVSAQKRMRRRLALCEPPCACFARDCEGDWSQPPTRPWSSSAYRMTNARRQVRSARDAKTARLWGGLSASSPQRPSSHRYARTHARTLCPAHPTAARYYEGIVEARHQPRGGAQHRPRSIAAFDYLTGGARGCGGGCGLRGVGSRDE